MRKTLLIAGLFVCFGLPAAASAPRAQQEVVITIKDGMPMIPVALPEFTLRAQAPAVRDAAALIAQVLEADLKFSRVFQLLPKSYYGYIPALHPDKIVFKDWESIQAKYLLTGVVGEGDDGTVQAEVKLYDVKGERFMLGKRYELTPKSSVLRRAAHEFADEVLKAFGERPVFSTKIVFVSDRDGNDELYMMDYDGENQTRLTFNKVIDYMPAWSMDGQTIAYTSYRGGGADLYLFRFTEGRNAAVAATGTNFAPSFSPDGKKLAFCSTQDGNAEIYVAQSDGSGIRRLTFNKSIDTSPTWSPTGREIAFTSDRGGTPQIYAMDAEGSNVRRVSFGGTYHDQPAWSPAGDQIAYVSRVDQVFDIYVLNLRSSQIIKLTEGNARNESPAWSPDGRHLVFSSSLPGTNQIYGIDYDGAGLRRLTSLGNNKLPDWSAR
ncbi:MAG: Tol-Pal system beta propeller repeat protein TolB [Candidatus Aminicenantes bacterium]|nr:Tol-Pal system beta propeller repeat protein TolB [Candidatus Aminicenantes bacterium]